MYFLAFWSQANATTAALKLSFSLRNESQEILPRKSHITAARNERLITCRLQVQIESMDQYKFHRTFLYINLCFCKKKKEKRGFYTI